MDPNPTREDIMDMDDDELDDCIATLPLDHPLLDFALSQRNYEVQRRSANHASVAMLVGVATLLIVISIHFAEVNGLTAQRFLRFSLLWR